MKSIFSLLLLISAISVHASSDQRVFLAFLKPAESAVSLPVPANYLAAEIRIESSEEDWGLKLSGIEEARAKLAIAAKKEGFTLKIDRSLIFEQRYARSSFASSSGKEYDSYSDILILAQLTDRSNLIDIVKKFRRITSDLKSPKKVTVSVGGIFLALDNPEAHRAGLLQKIRDHVETSSRALFGKPAYTISGLDEPLRLRQSGEREIEVYLPFRVIYSEDKSAK